MKGWCAIYNVSKYYLFLRPSSKFDIIFIKNNVFIGDIPVQFCYRDVDFLLFFPHKLGVQQAR